MRGSKVHVAVDMDEKAAATAGETKKAARLWSGAALKLARQESKNALKPA